jgi:hypothetical protein
VTCCKTTAKGKQSCSVKPSAEACKPPKGGTATAGASESCYDACLPGFGDALLSESQLEAVVALALPGLDDPWGSDYGLLIERSLAELQFRRESPPPPMTSSVVGRTASRTCLDNYCENAFYCGSPSNTVDEPNSLLYTYTGDCVNHLCYEHDRDSFHTCVHPDPEPCYFSNQSETVDEPFFRNCFACAGADFLNQGRTYGNWSLLTCMISKGIRAGRALREPYPDCNCPPCQSHSSGSCSVSGVCNQDAGVCEPLPPPCQSDLDCNEPDTDCNWRLCSPTSSQADANGCISVSNSPEADGSSCDDGVACTTNDRCLTDFASGTRCVGNGDDSRCNAAPRDSDPDSDCAWNVCSPGSPNADASGCVPGTYELNGSPCDVGGGCSTDDGCLTDFASGTRCVVYTDLCTPLMDPDPDCRPLACSATGCVNSGSYTGEPTGSPCEDEYGRPGTCQPHIFYGQYCAATP